MIDLTPLEVLNKRGDFRKALRGYEPQEVDSFLLMVSERLEMLVRENMQLRERAESLHQQVSSQTGRERAVHEALVTAQELRADIRSQAQREAELLLAEAQAEARRMVAEAEAEVRERLRDAERRLEQGSSSLEDLERRRSKFLRSFRQLLERELDVVEVEEEKTSREERPIELELGGGRARVPDVAMSQEPDQRPPHLSRLAIALGLHEEVETTPSLDAPVELLEARFRTAGEALGAPDRPGDTVPADVDLFSSPPGERGG